jgi:hypothetical protein
MNGVFETTFSDPSARALHGILCVLTEMKTDMNSMRTSMEMIAELYSESIEMTRESQAKASEILAAHQERIDQYNSTNGNGATPPPDLYPLKDAPAGTVAADLPSGQRLLTLSNGLILRTEEDYTITAVLPSGEFKNVIPGPSNELHVDAGLVLTLEDAYLKRPGLHDGIQGLPPGVVPKALDEDRVSVTLPSGIRVDLLHDAKTLNVILPDGVVLMGSSSALAASGDTIQKHSLPDGTGFLLESSGVGGILYADGRVELSLPDGTDLAFKLGKSSNGPSPDVPTDSICQGLTCDLRNA